MHRMIAAMLEGTSHQCTSRLRARWSGNWYPEALPLTGLEWARLDWVSIVLIVLCLHLFNPCFACLEDECSHGWRPFLLFYLNIFIETEHTQDLCPTRNARPRGTHSILIQLLVSHEERTSSWDTFYIDTAVCVPRGLHVLMGHILYWYSCLCPTRNVRPGGTHSILIPWFVFIAFLIQFSVPHVWGTDMFELDHIIKYRTSLNVLNHLPMYINECIDYTICALFMTLYEEWRRRSVIYIIQENHTCGMTALR